MTVSPFSKDFDSIFFDVLTDYQNLDSAPDVTQGSTAYIMGSVLSSGLWGLYRYLDYLAKQQFPDTADTENLNHWGSIYGVARDTGDTDAEYLADILSFLRQPPAGGNALDFKNWALDQDESYYVDSGTTYYNAYATIVDAPDGVLGMVGIYTIPNDETIIGGAINTGLIAATDTYIESKRPLGMLGITVIGATESTQNVTMTVTAPATGTVDTDDIKDAIEDELNTMEPGEDLYLSTLYYIAKSYGADNVTITTPAADVTISNDNFVRAGTVTVTEV